MIDPLPYSFSIVATARSTALVLFFASSMASTYTAYLFSIQASRLTLAASVALAALGAVGVACQRGETASVLGAHGRESGPASTGRAADADLKRLSLLSLEGGEAPFDPPVAAGDLAADIAAFTNIEACVEHASVEPFLGDALQAIGYDSFVRDACR